MGNIAISVEHLGKRYRIGRAEQRPQNLRGALSAYAGSPFRYLRSRLREPGEDEMIWALKDVSFEVKHGEVLGIIGRNGAGKSTLLKILSRITEPTEGCAKVYGRVGSLLEVGTGFHPELTGRENIYLNGTILGMKRVEIDKKFDEIVDFSGIEKFLDTPVKRYSSGMYVRLAFAVAAHLNPEILLVDEVLAVGDAEFQKKCLGKMEDVTKEGRTVLFISHNMSAVQEICSRGILLEQGNFLIDSSIRDVVSTYLQKWKKNLQPFYKRSSMRIGEPSEDKTSLLQAKILDANGKTAQYIHFGEPFAICMEWQHFRSTPAMAYALRIYDSQNRFLCAVNSLNTNFSIEEHGIRQIVCAFDHNVLVPGDYTISIGCYIRPHTVVHVVDPCFRLVIQNVPYHQSHPFNILDNPLFMMPASWKCL
jgi:lipopolysaccharide transport system ATP-binding protein